jgi:antitoxin (DNA-binding transcriptional repressor) of toxin-antitoxin stability system
MIKHFPIGASMTTMTTTEFVKNIKETLDRLEVGGEEIILVRNKKIIARIVPGSPRFTALEALGDMYRTLGSEAAKDWLAESREEGKVAAEMRDPWDS